MTVLPLRGCCIAAAVVAFALVPLMAQDALAASASSTTSVPSAGAIALGDTVNDVATVSDPSALGVPSGTVSFFVCGPLSSASGCSTGGTALGTVSLIPGLVNATAASSSFVPDATGTWCFRAEYSGDGSYDPSSDGSSGECLTVGQATAHVASTPTKQSTSLAAGDSDQVTITGNAVGGSPSGTVSFFICGPLTDALGCAGGGSAVGGPVPLTAAADNTATAASAKFSPTRAGVWCFRSEYSGDSNYNVGSDGSAGECFTVLQPGAPSVRISSPTRNATYGVGQTVQANYSCAEASGGPGLSSCHGTAANGAPINTSARGPQTFSVKAVSKDGLSTTVFASYTVAGPPSVWITSPTDGGSYTLGAVLGVGYGCAEDPFGPGLASCSVPAAVATNASGTFPFTASVTSLDGQSATATIHYNVVPPHQIVSPAHFAPTNQPPTATPANSTVPLVLSGVRQSHRSWRRGGGLARITSVSRTPIGTTFRFTLNESARMRFAFTQPLPGRTVRGRCVAPTSKNRRMLACTRTVTRGALSFGGHSGINKTVFQGRVSGSKALEPGRYTLIITATDAKGQRATARLTFTITA